LFGSNSEILITNVCQSCYASAFQCERQSCPYGIGEHVWCDESGFCNCSGIWLCLVGYYQLRGDFSCISSHCSQRLSAY
jgi:hypothetical protein